MKCKAGLDVLGVYAEPITVAVHLLLGPGCLGHSLALVLALLLPVLGEDVVRSLQGSGGFGIVRGGSPQARTLSVDLSVISKRI